MQNSNIGLCPGTQRHDFWGQQFFKSWIWGKGVGWSQPIEVQRKPFPTWWAIVLAESPGGRISSWDLSPAAASTEERVRWLKWCYVLSWRRQVWKLSQMEVRNRNPEKKKERPEMCHQRQWFCPVPPGTERAWQNWTHLQERMSKSKDQGGDWRKGSVFRRQELVDECQSMNWLQTMNSDVPLEVKV